MSVGGKYSIPGLGTKIPHAVRCSQKLICICIYIHISGKSTCLPHSILRNSSFFNCFIFKSPCCCNVFPWSKHSFKARFQCGCTVLITSCVFIWLTCNSPPIDISVHWIFSSVFSVSIISSPSYVWMNNSPLLLS